MRVERLRCIKEKVKEVLDIDLDIEELSKQKEESEDEAVDELKLVESNMAIAVDSILISDENSISNLPAAKEAESDPTLIENITMDVTPLVEVENNESDGTVNGAINAPPSVKMVPLSELAPPPSDGELFGNVEQLQEQHLKQIEEFEKAKETNKMQQQQGFEQKLRMRQSKRRRQKLQEDQETALQSPTKT